MNATVRLTLVWLWMSAAVCPLAAAEEPAKRVAVITTVWRHNSHADVIASRLVQGYTLDGQGPRPALKLVSAYVDQFPENDMSRRLAREHGFTLYDTVEGALTLGSGRLAVDGVLLICEHGNYPRSVTGSIEYPKRRLFSQIVQVFEASGRVVPVFSDKHLEDDWADIQWIYEQVQRLKIPFLAGSSLPVLWRYPPIDVPRRQPLRQIVATSYGPLDAYGFHALEMIQCLAERRAQGNNWGESGVRQVQCLTGQAVWDAGRRGLYDRELLHLATQQLREQPLPAGKTIEEIGTNPTLFVVDYMDGLRASILWASPIREFTVAWRSADGSSAATCFWTQEGRPYMHFTYLLKGIESLIETGRPPWPAERTLLTSGMLDALLVSHHAGGRIVPTPHLAISYRSDWNWQMPPPPPPTRPSSGQ